MIKNLNKHLTNEQRRETKLIFRKNIIKSILKSFEDTDKHNIPISSREVIKENILVCVNLILEINL